MKNTLKMEHPPKGGSETPLVQRSTSESRAPVRYSPSANYSLLTENGEERAGYKRCAKNLKVGDEREVEVLRSFNWPPSKLIMDDGFLPARGYSQFNDLVWDTLYRKSPSPVFGSCSVFPMFSGTERLEH
ncbi:hypothetical protein Tco_0723893 [Tanacetum coccineum]